MKAVLVELALAYYREPLRYPHLTDPRQPLPAGFANLVPAFGSVLASRHLEATAAALAARPEEVLEAARFFVRHVLLAPGASHARELGFDGEATPDQVRQHYQLLIRLFHPDRQARLSDGDTGYAARLNAAYQVLRGNAAGLEAAEYEEEAEALGPQVANEELRRFFMPRLGTAPRQASGLPREAMRRRPGWRPSRQFVLAAALLGVVGITGFVLVTLTRPAGIQLQMVTNPAKPVTATERPPSYLLGNPKAPAEAGVKTAVVAEGTKGAGEAGVISGAGGSEVAKMMTPASMAPAEALPPDTAVGERMAALVRQQEQIAGEMRLIQAERENLERQQVEQARRQEAERQAALAAAERQQREVAEAEARLQAERAALERQKAEQAEQAQRERQEAQRREAEHQAALAAAKREQEEAAKAEAQRQAERQALERQKAEQARREQEEAQRREAERLAALATAKREQEEATKAEAQRQAERQALERQKAEQARREQEETQRREAERLAALATAKRKQEEAAKAEAQRLEAASKATADPNKIIAHLTQSYAAGDLDGFVGLFTPDARVTGGRGKSFIRSDYSEFFSRTPHRRLEITGIRWQADRTGRLSGTGNLNVKTRQKASEPWTQSKGTVRFELVPIAGGYQISRMEHTVQ
jgi:trichohyalin